MELRKSDDEGGTESDTESDTESEIESETGHVGPPFFTLNAAVRHVKNTVNRGHMKTRRDKSTRILMYLMLRTS